ncbi:unnamed protein product [Dovyalis caffra]|uniref:Bulb-type lectin domain-containing protein n=1 Tax=Dovyalis caffra TaxID=77055 RepID=A0AAV1RUF0_9ROSI|nr:unnamed protein product [Dovyalis caffra]
MDLDSNVVVKLSIDQKPSSVFLRNGRHMTLLDLLERNLAILDTGNFVLARHDSVNLWESFGEPTDTLLPTQIFSRGSKLVAGYSIMNRSTGRFRFTLQADENLVLYTLDFPSGNIYLAAKNGSILKMLSSESTTTQEFYHIAVLEYDGVFRHYVCPKRSSPDFTGWPPKWSSLSTSIPRNICMRLKKIPVVELADFNSLLQYWSYDCCKEGKSDILVEEDEEAMEEMKRVDRNISLRSSLTAENDNSSWTSPSGDFAFGFQQIGDAGFLLAIWFDKIPGRTIVWSANRNNLVERGSRVQFTTDGQLVLDDLSGTQIWSTSGIGAAYAAMLDTGNFVLASQSAANLWQSFDEPTDTMLPTQTLSQGLALFAPYLEMNYSDGRYMLILQTDGNLVLYTTRYPSTTNNFAYWSTQDSIGSGYQVIFNQSGYMYLTAKNGTMINPLFSDSVTIQDFYQRATLDYDGVFRHYVYPKTTASSRNWALAWNTLSFIPSDICLRIGEEEGSGACGYNSICRLGDDQRPMCQCPPGYSFVDPTDERKGCKQNFVSQYCDQPSHGTDDFKLEVMPNTNWLYGDYEHFGSKNEDWCRQACLSDCYCAVAIFNNGDCWKKRIPLSNGRIDPSVGGKALIKVRKGNSTAGSSAKKNDRSTLIIIGSVLLAVISLLGIYVFFSRLNRQKPKMIEPHNVLPDVNPVNFTYNELETATRGFKEELGSGAFGTVYKGALANEVLSDWSYDCFKEGRLDLLVEEDEEALEDMKRVERFAMVAIWCVQEDPSLRPGMKKVLQMLEGAIHEFGPKMGINQRLYMIMQTPFLVSRSNISLDPIVVLLKKCLKFKTLRGGKQVHAWLVTKGIDLRISSLNSKLVGMYASCGDIKSATLIFKSIQNPNVFALNWMVLASAFEGYYKEAIGCFCSMKDSIFIYNKYTFSIVLKSCVGLLDMNKGKEVHCMVKQLGFERDVCVANALVDMYGKCGCVGYARRVFDRMVKRDVVSWTSMISGYCNVGKIEEALVLFERMKLEGLEPNVFTWNAMISGYARRGDSDGAFSLLSKMTREGLIPDLVTWNAMIAGFVQGERAGDAFKLFQDMLVLGVKPNLVTVTGLLPACGMISSIRQGREIHGLIYRMEFDITNAFVASALIDMYSECGSVEEASTVFEKFHNKNAASWNAMIGCYGKHGMVDSSIELFERMQEEGIKANEVTLLCVISACSRSGYVEKGLEIFWSMKERYMVDRKKEHYACVVDMLSRSGRLEEAYKLVKEMPVEVTKSIAGAFFKGCTIHAREDLAEKMIDEVTRADLKKLGSFAMLSTIYATNGEREDIFSNIKKIMKERKVHKEPGFSQVAEKDEIVKVEIGKGNDDIEAGIFSNAM